MYYIKFDSNGYQEEARLSDTKPEGDGWYEVDDIDGKLFKLGPTGVIVEMPVGEKESYIKDLQRTETLKRIREERNRKLVESDWTQLSSVNSALSPEKIAEWESYRQALRDLPDTLDEDLNFEWPALPQ